VFRHPNKGFTHFKTVQEPYSGRSQPKRRTRLELLGKEPSAGPLQTREAPERGLTLRDRVELADMRMDLVVEPELDIIRTGITELEKERAGLSRDRGDWGVGGKKMVLSSFGGIFGGFAVEAASWVVTEMAGPGLAASALCGLGAAMLIGSAAVFVHATIGDQTGGPLWKKITGLLDPGFKRIDQLGETTQLLREREQRLLSDGK